MKFIDANVFVRVLVEDDVELTQKARDFFLSLKDSKDKFLVEDSVLAEVIWVCTSPKLYHQDKKEITERLISILENDKIFHSYKASVVFALKKYQSLNLDFVDCLAIAYKETGVVEDITTFDKKLKKAITLS
jgi:predicted nucleic-acid-binding protein